MRRGLPRLKLADLFRDEALLLAARGAARDLVARDARLTEPGHAPLRQRLMAGTASRSSLRWRGRAPK